MKLNGKMQRLGLRLGLLAIYLMLFLPAGLIAGGRQQSTGEEKAGIRAVVSILPQVSLVERIGGEHVRVSVLVGAGQDPHTFELTPGQVMDLVEADVYFGIGFPFEKRLLEKILSMNPRFVLIETNEGVKKRSLDEHTPHTPHRDTAHGDEVEEGTDEPPHLHGEGEPDPHIWLSPSMLKIICRNVYGGLSRVDPDREPEYRSSLNSLVSDLDRLDERLKQILAPYRGKLFYVFHPAFGYFADEYGLKQAPVEVEGKSPTPRQIQKLIENARRDQVRIIFVSPQFDRRSAAAIAEAIGGTVMSIDPLAEDILGNLEDIAVKIQAAVR